MTASVLRNAWTAPHANDFAASHLTANATNVERLPFTIRVVENESDLRKAVDVRHAAYARHLPELGATLKNPEAMDYDDDVVVLLAESKLDRTPLGTARIQTNRHRPLCVEQSIVLPMQFQDRRLAEVTRLGVEIGRVGRLVKIALVKASFMYCEQNNIEFAIAAGRAPIDQQYEALLFSDIYPEQGFVPLQHAGNLPHRVMSFDIGTGYARWSAAKHPLLGFFSDTLHPDISVERRWVPAMPHVIPAYRAPSASAALPR
ncbi:hypothetical protein [Noviherbaspirillum denitrificans]|uniref:GNAT family N-acetyltransferase n=1 Tax=Noviherbaspirillum denitrificans TaxID=1968433 RepID=A0A254TD97_9BURK|nr:hypothetical protein [Noviherbaspirillum denitrificans]OWW20626.1 hypothetical protein AYR66_15175 [Noviherbaspirillum denitrificans]